MAASSGVVEMNVGVGLSLGITIGIAATAPGAVFAQTDSDPTSQSPQQLLLEQIADLQGQAGSTPAELIEPLRALALLYEENGDHALAIAALEEARHVTRVHEGLTSANEALLLRQQIRNEKALELHARAWEHEQDMVTIARQNHDDIRMVPVFRELAQDRSDALEEYRAGGFPPEIELGCYYVAGLRRYDDTRGDQRPIENEGSCFSGQSASVNRRLRSETLIYYADAIEVIVKNGDYASPELRDLERRAFRVKQAFADSFVVQKMGDWVAISPPNPPSAAAPPCSRTGVEPETLDALLSGGILGGCLAPLLRGGGLVEANVGGWVSLVRLIAYEIRSGAAPAARADALADLADWHLLLSPSDGDESSEIALKLYERAYRELEQDSAARTSMFSAAVPVMMGRNPFTSTVTAESPRYLDIAFAITKYGHSEQIAIQETSRSATRAEERDLTRLIKSTRFRPRFVAGELSESAPVVVRYSLGP